MSASAPEREPAAPEASPEQLLLQDWWATVAPSRREQLTTLTAEEPLPLSVAADLLARGVACPMSLIEQQGRLVRRTMPPVALLRFLAAARVRPDGQPSALG